MHRFVASTLVLFLGASILAQPKVHPEELKLKPKVDAAIDKGVEALMKAQFSDGTWGRWGNYDGGKTALCVYALLKCGVPATHPAVRRAFLYLDTVDPPHTYSAATFLMAYGSTGLPAHKAKIKGLLLRLLDWQRSTGDFGYPTNHNTTRPDLSNTQYAALGYWMAQKHGYKVSTAAWRKLIKSTLAYQEKPRSVVTKRTGKHTVTAGKMQIAGFGYVRRAKPTGSMTAAGVAILQMCKIGLAERMTRAERRKVDGSIEMGLAWLGHHFSVSQNPGHGGGWLYYYLYGLERVGSLCRVEQMGDKWWYLEGAKYLLGQQKGDGLWRHQNHFEGKTAFALLFLRRATSLAAETGKTAGKKGKHLFSAGGPKDHAQVGGAGQQPLSLWVKGFGKAFKEKHGRHGIRVVKVEYLDGKRVLGQVAGNPQKAWTTDAYLYRAIALQRGAHQIRARIQVVAPDVPPGETSQTETVETPVMNVSIRDIFALWMEDGARLESLNLIRGIKVEASASSQPKLAGRALDGRDETHWVCAKNDKDPRLTFQLARALKASRVVFVQANPRSTGIGVYDRITAVELRINGSKSAIRAELDPDQSAVTTFALPKARTIRKLEVRIVGRVPGRQKGIAGFAKIALTK